MNELWEGNRGEAEEQKPLEERPITIRGRRVERGWDNTQKWKMANQ